MDDKSVQSLAAVGKNDSERGRSQLLSPNPLRVKFVTEILAGLSENRLTFAQVTRMNRKKMKTLAEQGYVKLKHGRYEEARKIFEILTFVDHKNFFHHLALGGAYQKLKKYLDAVFQYSECLRFDPENTNALVNRGEIFFRHKNFKRAAEDFRKAIVIDKTGKDLFANRARSMVIAIKRTLAKERGESKATQITDTPIKRKKISPLALMGGAPATAKSTKGKFVKKS